MSAGRPDLAAARTAVLAAIAAVPASLRPPSAAAPGPLTTLPADLETKLASRVAAGLSATGTEHPRGRLWQQVVLPGGSLAVVDAAGAGVLAAADHPVLAIVGAVVFLPLAAGTALAARSASRDPLRITSADRRAITRASTWASRQVWTGPLSECAERGLVVVAAGAAERIAGGASWRSGRLDDHRIRLDLIAELTQIDDQAHLVATARATPTGRPPSAVDAAWEALLTRVAALHAYANGVQALDDRQRRSHREAGDPVLEADLSAGSARDDLAAEHLADLAAYLDDPPAHGLSLDG